MANRHLSRSIILQTLFEWDFLPQEQKEKNSANEYLKQALIRNLREFAPGLEDDEFVFSLINRILIKQKTIDEIIEKAAPDWPIDKISVVDRNILRIGLTELLFGEKDEVPPKVAINEAIELAKTFGGENSGKFINGVLGAVYKELGEPGKDHHKNQSDPRESVDLAKLPIDKKGGALVYSKDENGKILFALVHDVFGYWTISKGSISQTENEEEGTIREIKKEIGLDINIEEKLGQNEYVGTHPQKGKSLKRVVYFLASSPYQDLVLEDTGGLDAARWFEMSEIAKLRIYNDIVPIITKAVQILSNKK
jgi:N utilization substance protein B